MEPMTLDEADLMIKAGRAKAEELGIKVAIAVLDPRGDLVALSRMDGAIWRSVPISQGKAAAAAAWDMPSGDLAERWDQPVVRAFAMMENADHSLARRAAGPAQRHAHRGHRRQRRPPATGRRSRQGGPGGIRRASLVTAARRNRKRDSKDTGNASFTQALRSE